MGDVRLGHDESGSGAEQRVEGAEEACPIVTPKEEQQLASTEEALL